MGNKACVFMIENINKLLDRIELKIKSPKPKSLVEALEYETRNLYIYHALRIAKGKLINDLRPEDISAIKQLKKYFEMVEENKNRTDTPEDMEAITKLYS